MRRIRIKQPLDRLMLALLILFALGVCVGCIAADRSDISQIQYQAQAEQGTFVSALWRAAQFHLLVCIAMCYPAGVLLIPAVLVLRGYFLACASAVMGMQGPLYAWITCGLPALLQLPSLFSLSCAGMRMSAMLSDRSANRRTAFARTGIGKYLIGSVIGILLCAAADQYAVPLLLEYVTNQ